VTYVASCGYPVGHCPGQGKPARLNILSAHSEGTVLHPSLPRHQNLLSDHGLNLSPELEAEVKLRSGCEVWVRGPSHTCPGLEHCTPSTADVVLSCDLPAPLLLNSEAPPGQPHPPSHRGVPSPHAAIDVLHKGRPRASL
jgi:hypothetical protein